LSLRLVPNRKLVSDMEESTLIASEQLLLEQTAATLQEVCEGNDGGTLVLYRGGSAAEKRNGVLNMIARLGVRRVQSTLDELAAIIIHDAIQAERQLRSIDSQQHQAEQRAIDAQIAATEAAIDRYLTAFENGTLDERTCGHRIGDLTTRLGQLKTHRDELNHLVDHLPTTPSPQAIERLQRQLAHVLRHGTHGQKKAVIEAHVAEIKIEESQLILVFKIPTSQDTGQDPENDDGPDDESTDPEFRTMVRVVGRQGLEP